VTATEARFARQEGGRFNLCRLYDFRKTPRFFELNGPIEQLLPTRSDDLPGQSDVARQPLCARCVPVRALASDASGWRARLSLART